jgi:DNA ligase-1
LALGKKGGSISRSVIEVRFHRGLYLPEIDLWLDPRDAKSRAFVSHAHADHFARHESALCSDTTAMLLHNRFGIAKTRMETLAFQVPLVIDGFRLRLLPAGHIPGSAMLHVTRLADNASLLYTGDFKIRRSRTTEAVNFLTADTLVVETTFGLPGYEFPNTLEIEAEILRFVRDGFDDGETPVLLAYSLGKAQETLALLEENGIPALLHPAAAAMTRACIEAGVPGLPEPVEFDGHAPAGHVVIAPPHSVLKELLKGLKSKRIAMLSGWALQPGAGFRYRVDAMIPFSDHADHPGLMECIQRVRPRRILTVHGFDKEFAAELRSRGMDAWSAAGGDQLELPIPRPVQRRNAPRGPWHKRVVCLFADFSDLCRLVGETGSRVAKIRFLASYFTGLENDSDLKCAVNWLASGCRPDSGQKRDSLLDASTLRLALVSIPGTSDERFREMQAARKDAVHHVRSVLQELQLRPEAIDLACVTAFIDGFSNPSGSMDRIRRLTERLATLHPAEGETLVKLLTCDLRIGLDSDCIPEAVATAFQTDPAVVQYAMRTTGDPGEAAVHARHRRLADAREFVTEEPGVPEDLSGGLTSELPFSPGGSGN